LLHRKSRTLNEREHAAEWMLPGRGTILQNGYVAGLRRNLCVETQEDKRAGEKQRVS
jgi:hypothetical protein